MRARRGPLAAQTLNNLAILYSDAGRLADAETAYTEALAIYRELARPTEYASLATSVNTD
jgi:Flp pilus assembly protein TadD